MAELLVPSARVHRSFLTAMREFRAEGRGAAHDPTPLGFDLRAWALDWSVPEGFRAYVAWLREQALENSPRPAGIVPATTRWWVAGSEYLGRITIRHYLTDRLREAGGHIGYDVRPSARRQGHATAMLRAALPVARQLGIETALVTCDVTNTASRTVIERNGGVFQDVRGAKLRFWVPTA